MKVGDYVRTKDGRIFKWNKLCTTSIEDWVQHTRKILFIEDEIKSSPNIIDLIEVGDYVNGSKVIDIIQSPKKALYTEDIKQKGALIPIINNEIKSIVTKEQFESMEYKLGE